MSLFERLQQNGLNEKNTRPSDISPEDSREFLDLLQSIVSEVRDRVAEIPDRLGMSNEKLHVAVENQVALVLSMPQFSEIASGNDHLRSMVLDELLGFGPIQDFLSNPTISEIMVNGAENVFVESSGTIKKTNRTFESEEQLLRVVDRMLRTSGRRVDQASPMVDARLPDGSRLNVILPPLAVDGPAITIRKFLSKNLTTDDLIAQGSLSIDAARFLEACVAGKMNILVSGGTGTGKTTILNILSSFIGRNERVVTIEDAVELTLDMTNLIRLESRPPNAEGVGAVVIRDLLRNSLRMRPDRIVVGEVRGSETIDMLQAMNTGHEGSLSTVHANSPRDALRRIETMVLLGGAELPLRAIREQVASAIDIIVHLVRDTRGRRFITSITEVGGMEGELISTADLFVRDLSLNRPDGALPELEHSGLVSQRLGRRGGVNQQ
jgi:pilus assembly protein CpaF